MAYTLKEKLTQLRDAEAGAKPAFMDAWNYVQDLRQLAQEVLLEIDRLEVIAWKYEQLNK